MSFSAKDVLTGLKSKTLVSQIQALSSLSSVEGKMVKQIPKEIIKLMVELLETSEKKPLTVSCLTSFLHLSQFENLKRSICENGGMSKKEEIIQPIRSHHF
jgi:hypothetical protein